ncbi:hypothetical protein [Rossellomorea vietnamensis]|uniref:hypothetical protein n=1 Tax=Rossellomorea vietnamensis TaxID=218284 RepID=UPI003D2E0EA1
MKKFMMLYDQISFFEVLVLIDFPNGINPLWYPLNPHFKNINDFQKKKTNAVLDIDNFIHQYFGTELRIEHLSFPAGSYLDTPVTLHFWVFTKNDKRNLIYQVSLFMFFIRIIAHVTFTKIHPLYYFSL